MAQPLVGLATYSGRYAVIGVRHRTLGLKTIIITCFMHGVHVHARLGALCHNIHYLFLIRLQFFPFIQPPMHSCTLHTHLHTWTQYTQRVNPGSSISSLTARSSASLDRRKAPGDKLASEPNLARLARDSRRASTKSATGDKSRNESEEGKITLQWDGRHHQIENFLAQHFLPLSN